jgi:hypothetical protein
MIESMKSLKDRVLDWLRSPLKTEKATFIDPPDWRQHKRDTQRPPSTPQRRRDDDPPIFVGDMAGTGIPGGIDMDYTTPW